MSELIDFEAEKNKRMHMRDRWRMVGVVALNTAMMVLSAGHASKGGSAAFIVETGHDAADAGVAAGRIAVVEKGIPVESKKYRATQKASLAVASGAGLVAMYFAGTELVDSITEAAEQGIELKNFDDNLGNVGVASFNMVGNQGAHMLAQGIEGNEPVYENQKHHSRIDRDTSVALAGAIMAGSVVPFVSEVAGVGAGIYTAWHLRPTEANINHLNEYHVHEHEHPEAA